MARQSHRIQGDRFRLAYALFFLYHCLCSKELLNECQRHITNNSFSNLGSIHIWAIIGPPAKRHSYDVFLAGSDWSAFIFLLINYPKINECKYARLIEIVSKWRTRTLLTELTPSGILRKMHLILSSAEGVCCM